MGCASSHNLPPTEVAAVSVDIGVSTVAEKEAAVLQRANALNLPEHLTLGLTLAAMEAHVASLPKTAVKQLNTAIRAAQTLCKKRRRRRMFPPNTKLNGYVNQFMIKQHADGGNRSVCERLREEGSAEVGVATIFVSWALSATMHTLLDAIRQYLDAHPELPRTTKFWVCDFVVRQGKNDLANLDDFASCVSVVGHTVLLLEPWQRPTPLLRTWCVFEVYHTQKQRAPFEVVMTSSQQQAFEKALVRNYDSVSAAFAAVDVRKCECTSATDTEWLLGELERDVGLSECNAQVIGLLSDALLAHGRKALARLPARERRRSALLITQLARLLRDRGELGEAEALYREALAASRTMPGSRHPDTLAAVSSLASLLYARGQLDEAETLFREALAGKREVLGARHPSTLSAVHDLGTLLRFLGQLEEADALLSEALATRREVLGSRHLDTLVSVNNLGTLWRLRGQLEEADGLLREAATGYREALGPRHPYTFAAISSLASLLYARGELDEAEPLFREALAGNREVLGSRHPDALGSVNNLGALSCARGHHDEAEALFREALAGKREVLGSRHPSTLTSINNLGTLMRIRGRLDEAEALIREALATRRAVLGPRHPHTLASVQSLDALLERLEEDHDALPLLFMEELEGSSGH